MLPFRKIKAIFIFTRLEKTMIINFTPNTVKTDTKYKSAPAFCGYRSKFTQELDKFIASASLKKDTPAQKSLVEQFKTLLPDITKPENKMGEGNYGTVYRIDDEYALKLPHRRTNTSDEEFVLNPGTVVGKLKTYYGGFIAMIGDAKILKNARQSSNHLPAGIKDGITDCWQKSSYYRDKYLPRFAALPQSAFDNVAADFKTLSRENKSFDTINPNNFLADGDELKIIDDLENPNDKFFNTLAGMVKVFLTSFDRNTPAEFDVLSVGSRRILLKKIILAGEKYELDFGSSMPEVKELNEALRLSDIQEPWSEIRRNLINIRRRCPDITERLKKVEEYLEELEDTSYNPFMD